jgi:hypothetical protein
VTSNPVYTSSRLQSALNKGCCFSSTTLVLVDDVLHLCCSEVSEGSRSSGASAHPKGSGKRHRDASPGLHSGYTLALKSHSHADQLTVLEMPQEPSTL